MKSNELIPLASVRLVPRGILRAMFWVGLANVLLAVALVSFGLIAGTLERQLTQAGVCLFIACYACGTATLVARGDRRPRATAPRVFAHLRPCPPLPVRTFAVMFTVLVLGLWLVAGWESALSVFVQGSGMLGGVWLLLVLFRRHMHRQATVVFTLYADGLLDPASTAAIDAARQQDPAFDAAVRAHQRLGAEIARTLR